MCACVRACVCCHFAVLLPFRTQVPGEPHWPPALCVAGACSRWLTSELRSHFCLVWLFLVSALLFFVRSELQKSKEFPRHSVSYWSKQETIDLTPSWGEITDDPLSVCDPLGIAANVAAVPGGCWLTEPWAVRSSEAQPLAGVPLQRHTRILLTTLEDEGDSRCVINIQKTITPMRRVTQLRSPLPGW